jgi:hypothetical protein
MSAVQVMQEAKEPIGAEFFTKAADAADGSTPGEAAA